MGRVDFSQIYRTHRVFVLRNLRRLDVQAVDLQDALQDVFLIVQRKFDSFEGRSALRTWIFGITHRVASGYHKRRRREGARTVLAPSDARLPCFEAVDPVTPFEHLDRIQKSRWLWRRIDVMNDAHRDVLVMSDIQGMRAAEVARKLQIPVNTVYSRLRRARAALARAAASEVAKAHRVLTTA